MSNDRRHRASDEALVLGHVASHSGMPALLSPSRYLPRALSLYPKRRTLFTEQVGSSSRSLRSATRASSSWPVSPRLAVSTHHGPAPFGQCCTALRPIATASLSRSSWIRANTTPLR